MHEQPSGLPGAGSLSQSHPSVLDFILDVRFSPCPSLWSHGPGNHYILHTIAMRIREVVQGNPPSPWRDTAPSVWSPSSAGVGQHSHLPRHTEDLTMLLHALQQLCLPWLCRDSLSSTLHTRWETAPDHPGGPQPASLRLSRQGSILHSPTWAGMYERGWGWMCVCFEPYVGFPTHDCPWSPTVTCESCPVMKDAFSSSVHVQHMMCLAPNAMGTSIGVFYWGTQERGLVLILVPLKS